MLRKMVVIFGTSNILWMMFAASQAFDVEIFPDSNTIFAQIGDSVSLTCSTSGCDSPSFTWRTQIDSPLGGTVRSEGTKSTLTMDPVRFDNEHSYLCTATCRSQKKEKGIRVEIYSFPKNPEIQMSGPLEVGKPVTVVCLVPDVYPFDRLEMDLLLDGHLSENKDFVEEMDTKSLETKSLEVTFIPVIEHMGKTLVCRAKLHITELSVELTEKQTTKELQVYISPKNTEILVNPSTSLQEGESVTMNCFSEGLPAPEILWSKKLDNGSLQPLSRNATLTLIAMRVEDSGIYVCEGVNPIGRDREEVELIVQEKLFTVEIFPEYPVVAQIGDSVVLICSVIGCESPSISWSNQINSSLSDKVTYEGTTSTLILSPVSFENEHSYLCSVTCGSRKQEKRIQVKLYSLPSDPEIEMNDVLVNGNPVNISCKVPDVYPFYQLEIELLKGQSVMKNKHFGDELDRESLRTLETKSLEMTFIPTTEDTGKVLVCRAKLHIGEMEFEHKQRESTQTLSVNAAPKDIQLTAFPSENVMEGDTVTISCTCGNVSETWIIILKKKAETGDKMLESTDGTYIIDKARLEDAGVYECESKTKIGSQLTSLTLGVKGRESNRDYFSSELLVLYFACSLIIPAVGTIVYLARRANMKGSYSLVEAHKSKV